MEESNANITFLYADNKIRQAEIHLSLKASNWYELSKREDFLSLIGYLHNQEILKTHSIPHEVRCLMGIQES